MNAIVPIPKIDIAIREATINDVSVIDALQKKFNRALSFFPKKQFKGYLEMRAIRVAECGGAIVGYIISRDRYLKRDELGVIYQLCVAPGEHRKLVGAALVRDVFENSAYGCKLYCLWCAQDLEANHFWEAMGFVPIAFRAGLRAKKRVHIFWEKRIRQGDNETPYWFPAATNAGAMREDRLVFPIPPGTHWSDAKPIILPGDEIDGSPKLIEEKERRKRVARPKQKPKPGERGVVTLTGVSFTPPPQAKPEKPPRHKPPKQKNDPRLVAAARELRDRWLEHVNENQSALPAPAGKYEVCRQIEQALTPAVSPSLSQRTGRGSKLLEAA